MEEDFTDFKITLRLRAWILYKVENEIELTDEEKGVRIVMQVEDSFRAGTKHYSTQDGRELKTVREVIAELSREGIVRIIEP